MHIFKEFRDSFLISLSSWIKSKNLPHAVSLEAMTIEPPKDPSFGDMATNAAMILAKTFCSCT